MYKTQKIMITAMMLFVSFNLLAQTSKWTIGLEGGPALSSLRGNDVISDMHMPRLALFAGPTLQYTINPKFSIKTGLAYELKGSMIEFILYDAIGQALGTQNVFMDYQYLTIPLLCRYHIGKIKSVQGFINAGPYASYLLSAEQRFPGNETDLNSSHYDVDMGFVAGAGAVIPLNSKWSLSAEVRNQLGLTNISKMTMVNNGALKHNSLQMLFGLQYQL